MYILYNLYLRCKNYLFYIICMYYSLFLKIRKMNGNSFTFFKKVFNNFLCINWNLKNVEEKKVFFF